MFQRGIQARADGRAPDSKGEMADQHDGWLAMLQTQLVPIYRWIYAQVGNRQQAEELTARVFDAAIRERYERYDHSPDATTNEALRIRLFQIARAVVVSELHAFYGEAAWTVLERMNRTSMEEVGRKIADDTDRANLADAHMHTILSRLPAREREVLTCRFQLGYSIERTAAQLRLSVAETMALQFVALQHASQLDPAAPVDEDRQVQGPVPEQAQKLLEGCGCR